MSLTNTLLFILICFVWDFWPVRHKLSSPWPPWWPLMWRSRASPWATAFFWRSLRSSVDAIFNILASKFQLFAYFSHCIAKKTPTVLFLEQATVPHYKFYFLAHNAQYSGPTICELVLAAQTLSLGVREVLKSLFLNQLTGWKRLASKEWVH